jgi:hypothetical protein
MGQGRLFSFSTSDSSLDRKNRNSLNLKRLQDLAERGDSILPKTLTPHEISVT